jgi:TetR/AcrR family transcriptional regulator, transcriptional repressor for nem operon
MAKPNPAAREGVVLAARALMTAKGYAATSVDQICETAGVTKGTFFHYFPSKEAIAGAALESYCSSQRTTMRQAGFFTDSDPLRRFEGFIDFVAESTTDPVKHGCLAGMFAQELSDTHPELRQLCVGAFAQLRSQVLELLAAVKAVHAPMSAEDPADLADHFLAVFEGAFVLAKAHRDTGPLAASLRHYKQYVRSLFAPGAAPSKRRVATRRAATTRRRAK